MDKLQALVKNFQHSKGSSKETIPSIDNNQMNADWVWEQMADIWGEQWMRERGETPSNMWITNLSPITEQHIKRGVERTVSDRLSWPPSLPEFLSLCLDFDTTEAYNRMINRKPVLDDVEYFTRQACGYECKRVLSDSKARVLFNKTFGLKLELKRKGKLPIRDQKLLTIESASTEIDKEISERCSNSNERSKSQLENRMNRIIKTRNKQQWKY